MTLNLIWNNLVSYCLQIGLLVGLAAFIPTALRLTMPRARLAFWHILLAACLLLPMFAPKRQEVVTVRPQVSATTFATVMPAGSAPSRPIPWNQIALGLLAAGGVIRLCGLGLGLWRLRQYRRRSQPLQQPTSWAVEAHLRISEDVTSPVTFGFIDPVVLLPANFPEMERSTQEAILCHEILHVRRKDWLVMLSEELVRGIFWFHPAIWWLLGEIGLAREQVVDRQAIEMTRSREEYVDALLAIAGAAPTLDLAPAPLFLRKRHLKQRVVSILKEVRMSKTRSTSALAAGLGILAAACWFVTMTFPLAAAPQNVSDAPGVSVDVGNSGMMHRSSVPYPDAARRAKVEGAVLVEAMLDGTGNVVDAHVLSGPTELRRAALQAVLQWHFANDTGANTRQVKINFKLPDDTPQAMTAVFNGQAVTVRTTPGGSAAEEGLRRGVVGGVVGGVPGGVLGGVIGSVPSSPMAGKKLEMLRIQGLSDDAKNRLMSRLPVHEGDILSEDSFERVAKAVREYDEHLNVNMMRVGKEGNMVFGISAPGASVGFSTSTAASEQPAVPGRITVGGNVQSDKLVSQAHPVYPPLAKQARISGVVKLMAVIARDGSITDLRVISGHPLLIPAALDAVKTWRYSPTTLNGNPVEVSTQIDVNFTLSDEQ
jgi:TonB family protein